MHWGNDKTQQEPDYGFTYGREIEKAMRTALLTEARREVEKVNYCYHIPDTVICQLLLKNGFIAEGRAPRYGNTESDRERAYAVALDRVLDAKRYVAMQRLHEESQNEKLS